MESTGVYWSLLDSTWTPWGMVKYCLSDKYHESKPSTVSQPVFTGILSGWAYFKAKIYP